MIYFFIADVLFSTQFKILAGVNETADGINTKICLGGDTPLFRVELIKKGLPLF